MKLLPETNALVIWGGVGAAITLMTPLAVRAEESQMRPEPGAGKMEANAPVALAALNSLKESPTAKGVALVLVSWNAPPNVRSPDTRRTSLVREPRLIRRAV